MRTVDERVSRAPPEHCFRAAADVERWPRILPHYRWVRFRAKEGFARGLVEMAAWRYFGPVGYPTWWVSRMDHDLERRTVSYRHVEGITRGMDVIWEISSRAEGGTLLRVVHEWAGPGWPLVGAATADLVIGPHFIHHIASRTLAGVAREAERRAGAEVEE